MQMIERNKEHHTQSLNELQQEVKSLKALLLNRPTGVPTSPSPLPPMARPSIPAWQLAGSTSTTPTAGGTIAESPVAIPTSTYPTSTPTIPTNNDKGKEVEKDVNTPSSFSSTP